MISTHIVMVQQGKRITNRIYFRKGKQPSADKMMNSNKPIKFQSIVFDFDGTLAELRLDFGEMKRRLGSLAREYLHVLPPSSLPALEWVELLVAAVRDSNNTMAEELHLRSQALIFEMEVEAARSGSLFSFTKPILRDLACSGINVAIITRNCEKAVRLVFPDIDDFSSSFLARDHVPRVKPDPDHLLRALHSIGAPRSSALMVGDHPLDIETGKRAGVYTAGVYSGKASPVDLARSGANWIAGNLEDLFRLLEKQSLI
ncbi:MAG: HAD family hydrolase [Syntrophobacteraceae bacterium]